MQTNAQQHPEVELLLSFKPKNNRTYSKKLGKKQAGLFLWDYMFNHSENDDENEK